MADRVYWIQLENRPWDACPNNIDRMHGHDIADALGDQGAPPITVTITSPETGVTRDRTMYLPVNVGTQLGAGGEKEWKVIDALILRRYTEFWQAPDDRRINPWDLNEPDPTDNGTMGTIPGPTLECNVGDRIIVHFRNKDFRVDKDVTARTHSLHPHGIVFAPAYDGAYPLSPPDPTQPIPPDEAAAWASINVTSGIKQGDRVPPGGTFTYIWDTFGWPTTAGIWHYHDHSVCDADNSLLGAIGFLVIHNPEDPDDVVEQDLPQGRHNGRLTRLHCFPLDFEIPVPVLPHQLEGLRRVVRERDRDELVAPAQDPEESFELLQKAPGTEQQADYEEGEPDEEVESAGALTSAFAIELGPLALEIDRTFRFIPRICIRRYIDPPEKVQILQYYHELPGVVMTINGRRFLGNTPTIIAGTETKMRFGLAAMNNLTFHTFHLHGHRWVIPGPQGNNPTAIQSSAQVRAVSQFEDTRVFGPANSFSFTINQGSFMGSRFTPDPSRAPGVGEWHMHCHVLNHMMPGGMMGSLLVIQGGELAIPLVRGQLACHADVEVPANTVVVDGFAFTPHDLNVTPGSIVTFDFQEANHTVTTQSASPGADPIEINSGGGPGDAIPVGETRMVTINGPVGAEIHYYCGIHGLGMDGRIHIV